MKKKAKKVKRKKLEPKARIRRRLMKLWTMAVHAEFGEKCAVCGSDKLPNAHHIESRIMFKGLRYDPMNGVLLCPTHHKFGKDSAHMAGCWFATWLKDHLPERYEYVLAHHGDPDPDLEDREVLASIESMLRERIGRYMPKPDRRFDHVHEIFRELNDAKEADIRKAMDELLKAGEITRQEYEELEISVLKQEGKEIKKGTADESKSADQG